MNTWELVCYHMQQYPQPNPDILLRLCRQDGCTSTIGTIYGYWCARHW